MPRWGLTKEQRESRPWGIEPKLLAPDKTITDPIHGEVFVTELERRIIDTRSFQRLRRIRQLGTAHLVYPSATNSRFSHALGALRAAQNILDVVLDQRNNKERVPDIFDQWRDDANYDKKKIDAQIARAVVLCRLGALLHDLGHVPFGHTLEDDLNLLEAHDKNEERFEHYWSEIEQTSGIKLDKRLVRCLRIIVLSDLNKDKPKDEGKKKEELPLEFRFVKDLVGNTICADLLDYLPRDHYFSGLPAQLGRRFLDGSYVRKSTEKYHPSRFTIRLYRNKRYRVDVVTELYKYLQYRYELTERVLYHHAKLAADVMLGKLVNAWRQSLLAEVKSDSARVNWAEEKLNKSVQDILEARVREKGDDALLEQLVEEARGKKSDDWPVVAKVGDALLRRRLYKLLVRCTSAGDRAEDIYQVFGSRDNRAALEAKVAQFVGIDPSQVALWIPSPKMREKVPQVIVQSKSGTRILAHESSSKGREIIESHHKLWSIALYVEPEIKGLDEEVLLAALADELEIDWDAPVAGSAKLADVLASRAAKAEGLDDAESRLLRQALAASEQLMNFRTGKAMTYEDLFEVAADRAKRIKKTRKKKR